MDKILRLKKKYNLRIIEDNAEPTAHPKIMRAKDTFLKRYEKVDFHKYYSEKPFQESC